jgi:hypothetical protein
MNEKIILLLFFILFFKIIYKIKINLDAMNILMED